MTLQSENMPLPQVLIESDDFRQLTPEEISAFKARFQYLGEIVDQIQTWLSSEQRDFKNFLDSLELDLAVNQNLPSASNERHTSYLIHASWTFDTTVAQMRHALPPELATSIDRATPTLDCSLAEFEVWLRDQVIAIETAFTAFSSAQSMSRAIAFYIAMDVVLGNLLVGCYKARLNARLLQET